MFKLRNMAFVYIFLTAIIAVGLYNTPVIKTYATPPVSASAELPKTASPLKSTVVPAGTKKQPVKKVENTPLMTSPDAKYFSDSTPREYYLNETLAPQALRNLYAASGFFLFLSVVALNAGRIQQILQPVVISTSRFANTLSMKYRSMSMKLVDTLKGGRVA